jgi:hypothetical protein
MKIPHPALGKKFCTSGEFRLAKNTQFCYRKGPEEDPQIDQEWMLEPSLCSLQKEKTRSQSQIQRWSPHQVLRRKHP